MRSSEVELARRYGALRQRIARAGGDDVEVVAVTKSFGAEAIDAAAACGIRAIGESYAQECVAKRRRCQARPMPQFHFVGRLQRNKVRMLADAVDVWQSVDRAVLINELAKHARGAAIMLQVKMSDEHSKGGCLPGDVEHLAAATTEAGLRLLGLMGLGPQGSPEESRKAFRALRKLVDTLGLAHCSMGMSDDLEIAVGEGATMVRVGRSLFGDRPLRGSVAVSQWGPQDRAEMQITAASTG